MSQPEPNNGSKLIRAVAWPVLSLLGLLVLSVAALLVAAFFAPPSNLGKVIGEAHGITRLVAIVVIVPLIGVLAILERIDGAAAVAALSAIAGYALGSTGGQ
jgi:hypothetical protein